MPELRLPGELIEPARNAFERGAASVSGTTPLEPAAIEGARAALLRAAKAGERAECGVELAPQELEAFRACFLAGGEHAAGLEDAQWRAILAAIDAAEGMRRPDIA
ncbi:hypothetical protein QMO56_18705 [Roseomonas sp. E05]|uniref:hypothetical protein n=1 Tax=Roseomonas sp. E05 TaxID=3046310 RepID=UPI0024B8AB1F|nr:hypothetical protein [Roseomonas sp. E05]MDJ0390145.1 hypothetical protein [Roseomonas sp. E05]